MRIPVILFTLIAAAASPALASCLPPAACYEIAGRVSSCRSIKKDDDTLLELRLDDLTIRETSCGQPPEPPREGAAAEMQARVEYLRSSKHFYVQASAGLGCESLLSKPLLARVVETCCDTSPATGYCALGGPLVMPKP